MMMTMKANNSFAVLVPCYRRGVQNAAESSQIKIFGTTGNFSDASPAGKFSLHVCLPPISIAMNLDNARSKNGKVNSYLYCRKHEAHGTVAIISS